MKTTSRFGHACFMRQSFNNCMLSCHFILFNACPNSSSFGDSLKNVLAKIMRFCRKHGKSMLPYTCFECLMWKCLLLYMFLLRACINNIQRERLLIHISWNILYISHESVGKLAGDSLDGKRLPLPIDICNIKGIEYVSSAFKIIIFS